MVVDPVRQAATGLHAWNAIVGEAFAGCTVDTPAPAFTAELWRDQINDLKLVRIRAPASKVSRWTSAAPRGPSGSLLLHLQVTGRSINTQRGKVATIAAGEGALCDPDRGYAVDFLTRYEMFVVELPLAGVVARDPGFDLDRLAGCGMDPQRSRLLQAFLRAAWDQRAYLATDADWRDCVSRTALDLALRAVSRPDPDALVGASAALRRAVIDHIRAHLADAGLRTSSIARALGVSPRSVQSVFEPLATTASGFILHNRLDLAARRLIDVPGGQSITQLAFDCGFSDSAYFSKCFSRRYGVPPRHYRRLGTTN